MEKILITSLFHNSYKFRILDFQCWFLSLSHCSQQCLYKSTNAFGLRFLPKAVSLLGVVRLFCISLCRSSFFRNVSTVIMLFKFCVHCHHYSFITFICNTSCILNILISFVNVPYSIVTFRNFCFHRHWRQYFTLKVSTWPWLCLVPAKWNLRSHNLKTSRQISMSKSQFSKIIYFN